MIRSLLPWIGTSALLFSAIILGRSAFEKTHSKSEDVAIPQAIEVPLTSENQAVDLPPKRPDIFYTAITERPLFAPSRRPESIQAPIEQPIENLPEEEPIDLSAPSIRLLGIMGSNGGGRALIALDETTPVWLTKGAPIAAWRLSAIGPDWIEITLDERVLRVDLYPK